MEARPELGGDDMIPAGLRRGQVSVLRFGVRRGWCQGVGRPRRLHAGRSMPGEGTEAVSLTLTYREINDGFASALAISGDLLVVSAPREDRCAAGVGGDQSHSCPCPPLQAQHPQRPSPDLPGDLKLRSAVPAQVACPARLLRLAAPGLALEGILAALECPGPRSPCVVGRASAARGTGLQRGASGSARSPASAAWRRSAPVRSFLPGQSRGQVIKQRSTWSPRAAM